MGGRARVAPEKPVSAPARPVAFINADTPSGGDMTQEVATQGAGDAREWMTMCQAVEYLRERGAAPWVGEPFVLYRRLEARLIETRVQVGAMRGEPEEKWTRDFILDPDIWEQILPHARINWRENCARAFYPAAGKTLTLEGIQFARDDIEKISAPEAKLSPEELERHAERSLAPGPEIVETHATIEAQKAPELKRGAKGKIADWQQFYIVVMEMLDSGELHAYRGKNIADLRRDLLARIEERLSEDSLRGPVRDIWYRFVEPSGA